MFWCDIDFLFFFFFKAKFSCDGSKVIIECIILFRIRNGLKAGLLFGLINGDIFFHSFREDNDVDTIKNEKYDDFFL